MFWIGSILMATVGFAWFKVRRGRKGAAPSA